jgi:hypothetical protein
MRKFKTFYERAEAASNHKLPAALKFIQKHEKGIRAGARKDKLKVLRYLSNPKKVPTHLLLHLYSIYTKGSADDNVIQFPDSQRHEDLVAEADDVDPFELQPTKDVEHDPDSPEHIIHLAIQNRLNRTGKDRIPSNTVTHKGLVQKLTAQDEMVIQGVQRGPILLYGPSGIGKTVGIREYAIQTAIRDKRKFVELPLRALVSNSFDKDAPQLTVYPDPSDTVVDNTGKRKMIGVPESTTNVLNNIEDYFILLTSRPSQLNPLIFGGIPGEEETETIKQEEVAFSREAKGLTKDALKRQETKEKNESPTRFKTVSYISEPGGGDFGHLIKAAGKFKKARGLIFLDEITRVEDDLFFTMIMPYTEPDNLYSSNSWSMVAAGNAGDQFVGIKTIDDTAIKDRFSILSLKHDPEQWLEYARGQGLNKHLDEWITDTIQLPFDNQNYNTSLDDVFSGKTYAYPEDMDPDDPAEDFKLYENQTWTPRRILDKVSVLLNAVENYLNEKLEEGDPDWDRDEFLDRQLMNIGTEINVDPVSDSFLRFYSEALSQQQAGIEATGPDSGDNLAEYIWRHMSRISNDISEIKATFINPFDKKSDVVLTYGADEDNPFAAFNANTEEGKAARIKGIQEVLANDDEANKMFTTSILKKVEPLLDELIQSHPDPIAVNPNQQGAGSEGVYDIIVSMNNELIGILYKVAWIFNMVRPGTRIGKSGLKFDVSTDQGLTMKDAILEKFCTFMQQNVINSHLADWIKVLAMKGAPEIDDTVDPLDRSIADETDRGQQVTIEAKHVLVDLPVNLGGVTEYNPELLPLKLLLTLIRYIAPHACPQTVSSQVSELEELLATALTADIQGHFDTRDSSNEDHLSFYKVEPGGIIGNIVFDNVSRPGPDTV